MNLRNRAIAAGLSATLAFGTCAPIALASPQDDLAAAAQRLDELGGELATFQDRLAEQSASLEDTSYRIGEKQAQMEQTELELEEAKDVLGARMRSAYKSGASTLIEVLLGSESLTDVIGRIYYMDKVARNDAESIQAVKDLDKQLAEEKADLEQVEGEQRRAVEELEGQVGEYSEKVAEAQRYYDSLDAQIQEELARKQQEEENARIQAALEAAERERAREEAEQAAEQEAQQEPEETPEPDAPEEPEEQDEDTTEPAEEQQDAEEEAEEEQDDTPAGGVSYGPSGGGLSTARACIGKPYVWGATGPDGFDCSGLVCYCYGFERGRDTYSMISSLQSTGSWKTSMSDLSAGDLIFTSTGHVGIYLGNGQMIHSPSPGRSVQQADVYSFIGGGTY